MLVVPGLTPFAKPGTSLVHTCTGGVALLSTQVCVGKVNVETVAYAGTLELQVSCEELVTSSCKPVAPEVPIARKKPGCPVAESASNPGMMVSAVICSGAPLVTVNVAAPVTTLPSGFDAMAVMATVP